MKLTKQNKEQCSVAVGPLCVTPKRDIKALKGIK